MMNEIELKEQPVQQENISFVEETRNSSESEIPFIQSNEHFVTEKPNLKKKISQILKYLSMLLVGVANLLYSGTEILFSTKPFTGSLSLLGDGIHNLSDVLTLIIAFWAERVKKFFFFEFISKLSTNLKKTSKVKNSKEYTYGMQRAELIGGLINSIFLLSTAVFIIVEASKNFSEKFLIIFEKFQNFSNLKN